MAAFQALGPFISTFADPAITALLHNENGEIVITDTEQLVSRMIKIEEERASAEEDTSEENSTEELVQNQTDSSQTHQKSLETEENNKNNNTVNMDTEEDSWEAQLVSGVSESTSPEEMRAEKFLSSSDDSYSSFLYWREPVESLQLTDEDLAMSNIDNDNLDNLPDELLKLELSSTQNETKEETDFTTDVLTHKTDEDKTESCDRVAGEGKAGRVGAELFLMLLCQVTINCGTLSPSSQVSWILDLLTYLEQLQNESKLITLNSSSSNSLKLFHCPNIENYIELSFEGKFSVSN